MINLLAIAIGGAVGSLCRYGMSNGIYFLLGRGFPYGTLAVNILGSTIMGIAYVLLIERLEVSQEWRMGIIIGLLGAFTTFSTFSIEAIEMINEKKTSLALIYIFSSLFLCLLFTFIGLNFNKIIS